MNLSLERILNDEALRRREFPVTGRQIFMAHAGVAPLTRRAADAMATFAERGAHEQQEGPWVWPEVLAARKVAATWLGCDHDEVSLLGPTSLGLSLVAQGLDWKPGDEVVYYPDDYPANVYPWTGLAGRGVRAVPIRPPRPGRINWDTVEAALTEQTRLVALASCHFLTGYRIDIEGIGRALRERGILFCLDGIQTLGAFPTPVEYVDFLSADSHKWMLGPVGAGLFYVRKESSEKLAPVLRGSWNVQSPDFIAQDQIRYEAGGRRYEPGTLNLPGILAMKASLEVLAELGTAAVAARLARIGARMIERLGGEGFEVLGPAPGPAHAAIVTCRRPGADMERAAKCLAADGIVVSLRRDRAGTAYVRLSPHCYITDAEVEMVLDRLAGACAASR